MEQPILELCKKKKHLIKKKRETLQRIFLELQKSSIASKLFYMTSYKKF